jgi:hypothetical protein
MGSVGFASVMRRAPVPTRVGTDSSVICVNESGGVGGERRPKSTKLNHPLSGK